jgi:hypothetical protein
MEVKSMSTEELKTKRNDLHLKLFGEEFKQNDNDDDNDNSQLADPTENESIDIELIDGDERRNDPSDKYVDFTMGDHHYHTEDIPEDQILIDQRMTNVDIIATKEHEFTERLLMKYCGMDYDHAHDIANIAQEAVQHMIDPGEGDGRKPLDHSGNHRHWHVHGGNHHHDQSGNTSDAYNLDFFPSDGSITKEQRDGFNIDMTEAIKTVALKHGLEGFIPLGLKPIITADNKEDEAIETLMRFLDLLKQKLQPLETMMGDLLNRLPSEPGPEDKEKIDLSLQQQQDVLLKEETHNDNPPDLPQKIAIINSDQDEKQILSDMSRELSRQLTEFAKIHEENVRCLVRQEINRAKGKVE